MDDGQSASRIFEFLLSVLVATLLVSQISAAPDSLQASEGDSAYFRRDSNKNFAAADARQLPGGRWASERNEIAGGEEAQSAHPLAKGSQAEVEAVRLQRRPSQFHEIWKKVKTRKRGKRDMEKRRKNEKSRGKKRGGNKARETLRKRKNKNPRRREKGKRRNSKGKNRGRKRKKGKRKNDKKKKKKDPNKHTETDSVRSSHEENSDELTESIFPCSILYVTEMTGDLCKSRPDIDPASDHRIAESGLSGTQLSPRTFAPMDCLAFRIGQVMCNPLTMALPSSGINVTLACIPQRLRQAIVISHQDK